MDGITEESGAITTAPIPWIGKAVPPTQERQPWSSPINHEELLSLRFQFQGIAFFRCSLLWFRINVVFCLYCLSGTFMFFYLVGFVMNATIAISRHLYSFPPWVFPAIFQLTAVTTVLLTAMVLVVYFVLSPILVGSLPRLFNKPTILLFGIGGGQDQVNSRDFLSGSTKRFRWHHIRRIENVKGDLFFVRRPSPITVIIPRETFTGAEQATRFYDALVALWKSHGDSSSIPAAVLAEFASRPIH